MKKEQWRPIPGHENTYSVSSFGRLRRDGAGGGAKIGRILSPRFDGPNKSGYSRADLYKNGIPNRVLIHRLVASVFLGPAPSPKHEVAHNDGNPSNNLLVNLRWATPSENQLDRRTHETDNRGVRNGRSKISLKDVPVIRSMLWAGITQQKIAAAYGLSQQQVSSIKRRKVWGWLRTPKQKAR